MDFFARDHSRKVAESPTHRRGCVPSAALIRQKTNHVAVLFDDGDFDGYWQKTGKKTYKASISKDYEDRAEWVWFGADDVDAWFVYYDIEVDGDEIRGKVAGEIEVEWDFWFFETDHEEELSGSLTGHATDW